MRSPFHPLKGHLLIPSPKLAACSSMATAQLSLFLFFSILSSFLRPSYTSHPTPTPWPTQFHSLLYTNRSGALRITDLYYDWPNGRNFNIVQRQLGNILYDLEWTNGTSFYYTLDSTKECRTIHFEVGILRPNWLDGAKYLGQEKVDGFLCNVWTKADFIWYYEDVATKRPVHWLFFTGMSVHVMTFEVGVVLEDSKWQAPVYCFEKQEGKNSESASIAADATLEALTMTKMALRGLMGSSM